MNVRSDPIQKIKYHRKWVSRFALLFRKRTIPNLCHKIFMMKNSILHIITFRFKLKEIIISILKAMLALTIAWTYTNFKLRLKKSTLLPPRIPRSFHESGTVGVGKDLKVFETSWGCISRVCQRSSPIYGLAITFSIAFALFACRGISCFLLLLLSLFGKKFLFFSQFRCFFVRNWTNCFINAGSFWRHHKNQNWLKI